METCNVKKCNRTILIKTEVWNPAPSAPQSNALRLQGQVQVALGILKHIKCGRTGHAEIYTSSFRIIFQI